MPNHVSGKPTQDFQLQATSSPDFPPTEDVFPVVKAVRCFFFFVQWYNILSVAIETEAAEDENQFEYMRRVLDILSQNGRIAALSRQISMPSCSVFACY